MASLAQTVAALKALRRPGAEPGGAAGRGRLKPVIDFGPNPGELRMLVHAPAVLAPEPGLVVVLHGCGQTAEDYAAGAGWIGLADGFGFVVLCPEQVAQNNPNRCFNWFEPGDTTRGSGEAASIRAMIARAMADHGVAAGRVHITGLSAGGAMTAAMLAAYPEVFAAGGVVAGLPHGAAGTMQEAFGAMFQGRSRPAREWGDLVRAASPHKGPWPRVSIWHGEADGTVNVAAAGELARQWTDVHGLSGPPAEARSDSGRAYGVWRSARGEPVIELHRFAGMGHGTPISSRGEDGYGTPGPYLLEIGVSSSLEMARAWGLADAARPRAVNDGDTVEPAGAAPRVEVLDFQPVPQTARLAVDIGDTISTALRAAGLLK